VFFSDDAFKLNEEGEVHWHSTSTRPRIVILGTGWGSISFLKGLDVHNYEIVVVSPRNYFLFTPLLPSACTGALELGSLVEPIRQILLRRHQTRQSQYVEAKAVGLDRNNRRVQCVDGSGRSFYVEYDHLIIGVGALNNTFNTKGVKENAFFLKEAKHARIIRAKILSHFERAASPTTSLAEKEQLLQFVVVGGGPTGVEFAGELIDLLDTDLSKQFPSLIPLVRVRLLQSNDHILNSFDAAVSAYAEKKFKELASNTFPHPPLTLAPTPVQTHTHTHARSNSKPATLLPLPPSPYSFFAFLSIAWPTKMG
jgi:NADH dehydrogenase FAD-containing subunit